MKLVAALLFLCAGAACSRAAQTTQQASTSPSVALVTAHSERFRQTVAATGRFGASAGTQARLAFAEPGVLAAVPVSLGEHVSQGDVLARLDLASLQLGVDQASADVRVAQAARRQAQIDRTTTKIRVDEESLRRARMLYDAGVGPRKDIDAAEAQLAEERAEATTRGAAVDTSSAQITGARTRVAIAQNDLAKGILRAPFSGVVVAVMRQPGEAVDPSTPVVAVAPQSRSDLTLLVATPNLARVQAGDSVRFEVAGSGISGNGVVTGVAPVLDPESQTGNVAVRADVPIAPAGSMVQAAIDVASTTGIVLPEAAIVQDPQTSKTFVFVSRRQGDGSQRFEQREVVVRDRSSGQVLLAYGVRQGERVAAQGAFALLAPAEGGGD